MVNHVKKQFIDSRKLIPGVSFIMQENGQKTSKYNCIIYFYYCEQTSLKCVAMINCGHFIIQVRIKYRSTIRCKLSSDWSIYFTIYIWNTGRLVFWKGSHKNTGRPVFLRVDPYFRYGSTRIFTGRPVFLRVDPYYTGRPANASRPVKYGSTRKNTGRPVKIRVDPYITGRPVIYGSTRNFTGRPVKIRVDPYLKYGSTRKNTGRPVKLRVDPYFQNTGRPVSVLLTLLVHHSDKAW